MLGSWSNLSRKPAGRIFFSNSVGSIEEEEWKLDDEEKLVGAELRAGLRQRRRLRPRASAPERRLAPRRRGQQSPPPTSLPGMSN